MEAVVKVSAPMVVVAEVVEVAGLAREVEVWASAVVEEAAVTSAERTVAVAWVAKMVVDSNAGEHSQHSPCHIRIRRPVPQARHPDRSHCATSPRGLQHMCLCRAAMVEGSCAPLALEEETPWIQFVCPAGAYVHAAVLCVRRGGPPQRANIYQVHARPLLCGNKISRERTTLRTTRRRVDVRQQGQPRPSVELAWHRSEHETATH
jgi:hypothetical protein